MDPKLPEGLGSAFEPFQSEDGNYVRLAYSIFPDDYEPLDDRYGKLKSSVFIERVDGTWFAGIEFADEHRGRGLSRLAIQGLCNYLGKQADKYNLSLETPIFIAADSSEGFWEYIGFIKNTDGTGPELVSTLGRMCAWAKGEALPEMPMGMSSEMVPAAAAAASGSAPAPLPARTPRSSTNTVMRRPSRLSRTRTTPYSRKGGKVRKSKIKRRKTKGRKSQRHKRIRSTTIRRKTNDTKATNRV